MRRLFTPSRRASSLQPPELRNREREILHFRRRILIAGVAMLIGFFGLFGRFIYLQIILHQHYQTLAESNRIAIVPIAPNRGVITDRNGVVLAQSYSAYTLEMTPSRVKNLDAMIDELVAHRRRPAARPQALQAPARGVEELREPAAAHAIVRRGSGALRGQPLPLSGRRDQGSAVSQLSLRRDRVAPDRLHRPHQRARRQAHRRVG